MFHVSAALLLSAALGAASVRGQRVRGAPPRTPPLASAAHGDQRRLISNGKEAPVDRYPYAVYLVNSSGNRCGGSLIADNAVLTAARCADYGFSVFSVVRVGAHDVEGPAGVTANVEKVENDQENDLAIVILDRRIEGIRPVCMADPKREVTSGEALHVLGWGSTEYDILGWGYSSILQEAGVEYLTNEECKDKRPWVDMDTYMCTTSIQRKGACTGDDGGPLIVKGGDADEDMLVGVVSDTGCGSEPDLYSRISEYRTWIDGVVAIHKGTMRTDCAPPTIPLEPATSTSASSVPLALGTVVGCVSLLVCGVLLLTHYRRERTDRDASKEEIGPGANVNSEDEGIEFCVLLK